LLTISDVSNAVTTSNYTVTINGAGTGGTTISRVISDNGAGKIALVINTTNGTTTLSGTNTFTGGLLINNGTVTGTVAGAMGTASNTVTFGGAGAGVLNLQAAATTYTALLNVASANGTILVNPASSGAGVTHVIGATTLGGDRQLTVQAGSNVASGTMQLTTGAVTLSGNATLNAVNTATASTTLRLGALNDGGTARMITLVGNGTVWLGAAATGLATGTQFIINSGTLNATIAGALTNSATANATTVTVNSSGELRGTAAGVFKNTTTGPSIAINLSGGTVRLMNAANTDFGGNLNYTSGNLVLSRVTDGAAVTHTMGSLSIGSATLSPTTSNFTSTTPTLAFGSTSITGNAVLDSSQVKYTLGSLNAAANASLTTVGSNTTTAVATTLNENFAISNNGTGVLTVNGGITGSGNLTLNNNNSTASGITISTASANNTGTITTSGSGSGSVLISGGVGSNVSRITQNSSTSNLTVGAIALNSAGTTLVNNQSGSTANLSVTGGITGAGDLTLNNNSSTASGITISTASANNTGTITNSGSGTGSVLISSNIGTNVTGVTQNSANSTLTLSGANSYTGATTISAGTLQIGAGSTTGSLSASSSITNNGTLAFNRTNTITQGTDFASVISGTGNLIQAGSGNLILSGANAYTGTTTISAGTLQIGAGSTTGSLNANSAIINNGTLAFNRTNTVAQGTDFASVISGTGNLTQAGSGNLTLSGNNTYTGVTAVTSGTLEITSTGRLGGGSYAGAISNNGSFIYSGTNNQTLSGVISGTGALTQSGTEALTLSGANTFTDGVTLNNGTLNINNATALGNATVGTFVINGGTIDNTSAGLVTVGAKPLTINADFAYTGGSQSLSLGTGATTLGTTAGTSRTITVNANTLTLGGAIANGTTANSIIKAGAGTLTLNGTNTYTGATTINAGTLQFARTASLYNGTTASWTAANIKVGSGATLMLSVNGTGQFGTSDVTTLLTNLGGANGGSAGGFAAGSVIGFDTSSSSTTISDNIADTTGSGGGSLGLTKAGANTLTLSGNLSFSGGVTGNAGSLILSGPLNFGGGITVNGGTLRIGNGTSSNAANYTGPTTINGGTLTVSLNGTVFDKDVTNNGNLNIADGVAQTLTGNISGTGNLTYTTVAAKSNVISGVNNSYTGQTSITSSVQISKLADLGVNSSLGAPTTVANGTINLNQTLSSNARLLYVGSGDTSNRTINFLNNTGGFNSEISSSGSGALVLTSDLTTSGAAKTLVLSGNNTGNNMIQGIIPDASGGNATTLVKSGAGTWVLTGANTFTGTMTIGNGSLSVAMVGNANSSSNLGANGTINIGSTTTAGTLVYTGVGETTDKVINLAGTTGGAGIQADNASGTLKFTSNFTAAGAGSKTLTLSGNGNAEIAGSVVNNTGNTTSLTKSGTGTWTLSGNNTYGGATAVNGGILVFSNTAAKATGAVTAGASGSIGLGVGATSGDFSEANVQTLFNTGNLLVNTSNITLNVASSLALDTTAGNFTQSSALMAARALIKLGANTLTLSANSTYTGTTAINAGTLEIASTGRLGGGSYSGNITNNGAFIYSGTNSQTLSGVISGTGALSQNNASSTLTLSGNNSFTGGTTLSAGTLQVGDANALGTSGNITFSGGTMSFSSTGAGADYGSRIKNSTSAIILDTNGQSVTFSSAIGNSNANGLTKNGSGTLTLSGANDYTGATTVNAGTLSVVGSVASSAIAVNNGGALSGNGTTGAITIASGGSINPGVGVGTINTGGVTLNGGGVYNWQLWNAGGAAGTDWDLLKSTGALTIGAGSNFTINISTVQNQAGTAGTASGFVNSQNYSWRLAEFGSAISGFNSNFFTLNSTGFQNSLAGSFSLNATGNFLNLLYTTNLADITYTAGTGNWSTAANWNSNPNLPTSANALTINGTGGTSTNDLLDTVQSLALASSAGSYTIAGSGNSSTVTLNGGITNSSSNNQTISMGMNLGADQSFQSDTGYLLLSGALGTSNRTLTVTGAGNVSITNTISGSGNLTKTGTGTLTLDGSNTYTGATTINGGTLTLNGGLNNSSVTVNGGLLNQTSTGSIAGIGTTFTLTTGNATLAGTNTYTGATTINGGTLEIASTGRLGGGSYAQNISNNGTFIYSGTSNQTLSGIISGSGVLTKNNSASTLTLAGSNTYTGSTTINAGTLEIGSTGRLGVGSYAQNIVNSGTFLYNGTNNQTLSGVISGTGNLTQAGSGNLTLSGNNTYTGSTTISAGTLEIASSGRLGGGSYGGNISNNGAFLYSGTNNQSLSGVISGTGALTQNNSSSTLTLSGSNTYTGNTTVSAGILNIQHSNALGGSANGTIVVSGAVLQLQGGITIASEALTLNGSGVSNGGALINSSGNNEWAGNITIGSALTRIHANTGTTLTISGNITNNAGGALHLQGPSGANIIVSGIISGNGSLNTNTTNFPVSLTLSGNNTYTGKSIFNSGTISINSIKDVGAVASSLGAPTTTANGTIDLGSGSGGIVTLRYTGSGDSSNRTINLISTTANQIIDQFGTGTLRFTSNFTATGAGSKTLILQGSTAGIGEIAGAVVNNNSTNTTSLTKNGTGTWILSGANTYTGATTINAGTLQIGNGSSTGSLSASSAITNNGTLVFNRSGIVTQGTDFATNGISGTGNLTQAGPGILILNAANSYTGVTIVANGILTLSGSGTLGTSTITITGGTLDLGGGNITNTFSSITGGTLVNGTITNNGGNYALQNGTVSTNLAGSNTLTKTGSNTLMLTGSNTYTGATTISAGNLSISSASALGSTSGVNLANGTALIYNGGAGDLTRDISVTGTTGSTGTIRNSGTGLLTLSGALSKNGTTLTLAGGSNGITVSGVISGSSNNSDLVIDGGTTTLTNANTYNGPTSIINGATLNANAVGALPTSTRSAISIDTTGTGSSTLSLGASQSVASLTGNTTSTVTLGSNTLTIGTTSGNTTYAGRITGASNSALVKDGESTQVLTGNNTGFAGNTTISGGTLQAAAAGAMGNSTVINVNGGSFLVTAENAVNDNAAINLNGGRMAVSGTFNENVGLLTLSANSTIDLNNFTGILRFGGVGSWAPTANLAIWNWNGTPLHNPGNLPPSGGTRHVVFASNSGLDQYLDRISFYSGSGSGFVGNAFEDSFSHSTFTGTEIIAVPEPETYLTGILLILGATVQYLRHRAKRKALEGYRPA
jgi:autotransporter-associated beta strand protein